ncbi:MAG: DUF58 domain-containing protein [Chitinivibrionales bacterium]|nr:DUF58 domain-containing protein [Chitinivibrionales bacterium]
MEKADGRVTFLRPEHVAPIRSLTLRAKCIVEGLITGLHKSPLHGFSSQFSQYRHYHHGEPARCIDWRKYAKSERTVVRLFEDETNCQGHILLDKSSSMRFRSTTPLSKFDYARTMAASLAWILIRQRDATGLYLFDETVSEALSPHSTNIQLKTILATLQRAQPGQATNCSSAIHSIAQTIHKRGMCILLSDLFDNPQAIIDSLRHLKYKKQDVFVIWILDPLELLFVPDAAVRLRDLESNQELLLDGQTAAQFYNQEFQAHRDTILKACRENAIDCTIITTDEPFHKAIIRILEKRRK